MALTRPRYSSIQDTDYKQSVRVATTDDVGNLLATGNMINTIDEITLIANDRILVKDQDNATQNGIYFVVDAGTGSNGTWRRSLDADANFKVTSGMTTTVVDGAENANKTFKLTTSDPVTLGVSELAFVNPYVITAGAAGANTYVQFSDVGATLGGSAGFTFNKFSNVVTIAGNVAITTTTPANIKTISAGTTAGMPAAGLKGRVYIDTDEDSIMYDDGAAWVAVGAAGSFTANVAPPTDPTPDPGEYWYDTGSDILFQYINDGTSNQWVDVTSATTIYSTGYGNNEVADYLTAYTGNISAGNLNVNGSANITGAVYSNYNTNFANTASFNAIGGNTKGGTGYLDFLVAQNTSSGATNPYKWFRLNGTGTLEIINSAYTSSLLGLNDNGNLSIAGQYQVNGSQAVNGPAFSAYAAAILQTIPNNAQTKVLFQTEEFDTNSNYTNSRFTPTIAGYYQLNAEVRLDGDSGTGEMMIILYKNGSEYKRGTNQSGTQIASNFWAMTVSSIAYANGTGDYFEIYVQQGSGADRTVTAVNNTAITWFNGCMVRGA